MLLWLFQLAFGGCTPSRLSRLFSIERIAYQVCFGCGQKLDYSWKMMRSARLSAGDHAAAPLNIARPTTVSRSCFEPHSRLW